MSGNRIGLAEKLLTVHQILDGKETQGHAAERLGISKASIQQWICIYKSDGEGAFHASKYKHYPKELKEQAVMDYLGGRGSQQEICQRYGIRSRSYVKPFVMRTILQDQVCLSALTRKTIRITFILTHRVLQALHHQAKAVPLFPCRRPFFLLRSVIDQWKGGRSGLL